jgi:hypothetical protein
MATQAFQFDHDAAELIVRELVTFSETADAVILAEDASQIAMGHEDSSRPVMSHQRFFLAEVGPIGGYLRKSAGPAESFFPPHPVDTASPGTECACFKEREGILDAFGEKSYVVSVQISRPEVSPLHDDNVFFRFALAILSIRIGCPL